MPISEGTATNDNARAKRLGLTKLGRGGTTTGDGTDEERDREGRTMGEGSRRPERRRAGCPAPWPPSGQWRAAATGRRCRGSPGRASARPPLLPQERRRRRRSASPSSRGEMDRRSPAPRSLTSPGALAAAMSSTVFELVRAVPRSDPSRALLCGDGQASTRPLTLDASRSRSRRSAARRATTGASSARCVSPSCTRPAPCDAS